MTIKRCAALVAAGLVSACGGGGGGGDGPDGNLQPVRTTMQPPSTTMSYEASSATGWVDPRTGLTSTGIDAAGPGSTITITTDADGFITSFIIDTNTASVGIHGGGQPREAAGNATPTNAQVLTALTAGLQELFSSEAGSARYGFLDLSYSLFGTWAVNDGGPGSRIGRVGAFAIGAETISMPDTGSATYEGSTHGIGMTSTSSFAFVGDAQVVADFSTTSVTTAFSNLVTRDVRTSATSTLPNLSGSGNITGNKYSGTIAGDGGLTGNVEGGFYGPGAAETAGVFRAQGGDTTLLGSYGAKKK